MRISLPFAHPGRWLLLVLFLATAVVYWPGLSGGWLFDDYPNIVDNPGVQPDHATVPELVGAALSSPSSQFKRPLASLSFAANYLAGGLDPWGWKLVNLIIHLLNGLLVFLLARQLLGIVRRSRPWAAPAGSDCAAAAHGRDMHDHAQSPEIVAALIAGAWMLLPINLTAVLYVVQRMESLANLFVLLGLVGYVAARRRMLAGRHGLVLCIASLVFGTALGVMAKETAVMLPFYAFLVEWIVFGFKGREPEIGNRENHTQTTRERVDVLAPSWHSPSGPSAPPMFASGSPASASGSSLHSVRDDVGKTAGRRRDWRVALLFVVILLLPMLMGLVWILPHVLEPATWARRDFTLGTRLLSEARIVSGYVAWVLVPMPHWLSFYHDNFHISTSLLSPWTTLAGITALVVLFVAVFALRRRWPLVSLGIALFLGCHLLTGTILPLELIYEHRNYFASFGLLLALVPLLAAPGREVSGKSRHSGAAGGGTRNPRELAEPVEAPSVRVDSGSSLRSVRNDGDGGNERADVGTSRHPGAERSEEPGIHFAFSTARFRQLIRKTKMDPGFRPAAGPGMTGREGPKSGHAPGSRMTGRMRAANPVSRFPTPGSLPFPLARGALLAALGLWWIALTLATSIAWSSPLRLAQDLAMRAPDSPRAQYELGRTYIIASQYDPDSPFTPMVYAPLERAAKLPDSSILPEQALIFFNARMHRPLKDAWWDSMIAKLKSQPPGVQDESSLIALTKCARSGACKLPSDRMLDAFLAALSHPNPNARLLANYGDFAWNILDDHPLGLRASRDAVAAKPSEPVYHITLARMYLALGEKAKAREQLKALRTLNYGGRLDSDIAALEKRIRDAE